MLYCFEDFEISTENAKIYPKKEYKDLDTRKLNADSAEYKKASSIYSFIDAIGVIQSINVDQTNEDSNVVSFQVENGEDVVVVLDSNGHIKEYTNNNVREVSDYFFYQCPEVQKITCTNLKSLDNDCISSCASLKEVNLPKANKFGNNCVISNGLLEIINVDPDAEVGEGFLDFCPNVSESPLSPNNAAFRM